MACIRYQKGDKISHSEMLVLQRLAECETSRQIADELMVSKRTVDFHLNNIYDKLGVRSGTRAVVVAARQGLIDLRVG